MTRVGCVRARRAAREEKSVAKGTPSLRQPRLQSRRLLKRRQRARSVTQACECQRQFVVHLACAWLGRSEGLEDLQRGKKLALPSPRFAEIKRRLGMSGNDVQDGDGLHLRPASVERKKRCSAGQR